MGSISFNQVPGKSIFLRHVVKTNHAGTKSQANKNIQYLLTWLLIVTLAILVDLFRTSDERSPFNDSSKWFIIISTSYSPY